jgi:putative endonuclease
MWYVYILQLSNGALYTGITNNIIKRLSVHRDGKGSKYVRANLPCELVYLEEATDRSMATKRELKIKKMPRAKKLELCCRFAKVSEV